MEVETSHLQGVIPSKKRSVEILQVCVQILLLLALVGQLGFFLFYRIVNLDEGWYLWAAKLVYEGQLLYGDFAYTQTPLLPYVYGLFLQPLGEGLYQGRAITVCFGFLALLFSAQIAQRHIHIACSPHMGRWAALICLALLAGSFYMTAYLSYTATYGLASLLLMLSLLAAGSQHSSEDSPASAELATQPQAHAELVRAMLATLLLGMAVATRLSVLGAAPALVFYIAWRSKQRVRVMVAIFLATLCSALMLIGPFLWLSGPEMIYDIFGFHTDRILSAQRQITKMGSVLQRTSSTYAAPLLLLLAALAYQVRQLIHRRQWWQLWQPYAFEITLVGMALGMFILHLIPRTTDDYYNTLLGPLLAILGATLLARFADSLLADNLLADNLSAPGQRTIWRVPLITGTVMLAVLLNVVMHARTTARADLIQLPPQNQIEIVRTAADFLRTSGLEGKTLLTLNTHLALEAHMNVPSGYEMSIFSYRPTWSNAQALRYKAINNELFIQDLVAGADALAITDFDLERFYGARQQIFETMWQHYRFAKIVPGFDPMRRNLYIYLAPRFTPPSPQIPLTVELANDVTLLGYDLGNAAYLPGDTLYLGLYWRAPRAPLARYTVFVHIVDSQGRLAANWDNPPCLTTCPTDTWLPDEYVRDPYQILLPADWEPGIYTLMAGMYESDTGTPVILPATIPQAEGQRIILGQIQILPR